MVKARAQSHMNHLTQAHSHSHYKLITNSKIIERVQSHSKPIRTNFRSNPSHNHHPPSYHLSKKKHQIPIAFLWRVSSRASQPQLPPPSPHHSMSRDRCKFKYTHTHTPKSNTNTGTWHTRKCKMEKDRVFFCSLVIFQYHWILRKEKRNRKHFPHCQRK